VAELLIILEGLVVAHHLKLLRVCIVLSAIDINILVVVVIRAELIGRVHLISRGVAHIHFVLKVLMLLSLEELIFIHEPITDSHI